jgi:hypothetical protein
MLPTTLFKQISWLLAMANDQYWRARVFCRLWPHSP